MKLKELSSNQLDWANAKWIDASYNGSRGLFVHLGDYSINHKLSKFGTAVNLRLVPTELLTIHSERNPLKDKSIYFLRRTIDKGNFTLGDMNEIKSNFKDLAQVAFKNWSLEQCKYIWNTGKNVPENNTARKVALWVAKKKFKVDLKNLNEIKARPANFPVVGKLYYIRADDTNEWSKRKYIFTHKDMGMLYFEREDTFIKVFIKNNPNLYKPV